MFLMILVIHYNIPNPVFKTFNFLQLNTIIKLLIFLFEILLVFYSFIK